MFGAIAGDVIGSVYEWNNIKSKQFELFQPACRFTDDTVLTVAVADALMSGDDLASTMRAYGARYPNVGYGPGFSRWLESPPGTAGMSWGNGAAMRISPVAYIFDSLEQTLREAERLTAISHGHPNGIRGAQAVAALIFLARRGRSKEELRVCAEDEFGYDLSKSLDQMRPDYVFDLSCEGTVPPAITAFLESTDFEDAIRNAISLGGDSDTLACICGSIAEAHYGGVPDHIHTEVMRLLDEPLAEVASRFTATYGRPRE
jgi:ADP-ribosylglycohydrolase